MAATRKKKNTRTSAARKGWETRRANERAAEAKKRAAAKRRAEKKRQAAELHARRVLAAKKGYRTKLAKERARAALQELRKAVREKSPKTDRIRESWHRTKRALEESTDDYDRYLAILDQLSDDEAPDWDIAYGSTESAA